MAVIDLLGASIASLDEIRGSVPRVLQNLSVIPIHAFQDSVQTRARMKPDRGDFDSKVEAVVPAHAADELKFP